MSQPIRLILVEDSDDDAELVLRALADGGFAPEHARVCTAEALKTALDSGEWDAVISDNAMPGFSARAALAQVQRRGLDLPFIIVSGAIGEDAAVEAMRAGAHDYLIKDRLARLAPSLRREVGEALTRREGRAAREQAEQAMRDKRLAEDSNQARGRFLATMSHELRTPLNAIIGFSELLVEQLVGELNPVQKEYLSHVLASGRHLLTLINEVLDISRIDAGRLELRRMHTDLAVLASGVFESVKPLADKRDITIQRVLPEDLPMVWVDPVRVKQVLYNLLSNAIKFTGRGGSVRLTVRQEGTTTIIAVDDTGVGIAESDLPRLFREFERIGDGKGAATEGTGLGLALARRLVELHGGALTVKSVVDVGSTFTVSLPRAEPVIAPLSSAPDGAGRVGPGASPHGRILIVEGEPVSRRLIVAVVERLGRPFAEATTLEDARRRLADGTTDLIVTDLQLAGGGGEALLEEVRRDPSLRAIPVVVTTALSGVADRDRLLATGFDAFLSKPIDVRQLETLVGSLLRTGR
jgi:signal transduction histidine kinase